MRYDRALVTPAIIASATFATLALLPSPAAGQASPSDFTYATRYDAAHRVVGTIAPDPDGAGPLHWAAVRNTYDADGRLVAQEKGELSAWQSEQTLPSAWAGFNVFQRIDTTYDGLDRKLTETTSSVSAGVATAQTLIQYSYDPVDRLECTAVRMNPASWTSLPASACTLGTTGAQGPDRITKNVFDDTGQVLQVRQAVGTADEAAYETYTYTANGKQASVTDANGNRSTFAYDGFDRLAAFYLPSPTAAGQSSSTDYEAYGYDANGNRTSFRRRDGRTLTFSYDALNRVAMKAVPDGCAPIQVGACAPASATRDVYYGYDAWGHQTFARYDSPSGEGITNSYDGFGELTSTTSTMGGASRTLSYQYDPDGDRVRVTHPDGNFFAYEFDGLDRQTYADLNGSTSIGAFAHLYNAQGLAYRRLSGGMTNWTFDGIGRLTSISVSKYRGGPADVTTTLEYNPASQIVTETRSNDAYAWTGAVNVDRAYAVNGLNQYVSAGPASFGYDANGNLIGDGTTTYSYDAENRLIASSNGTALSYDPLGRLWEVASAGGTTRFLYDGDRLAAEYDAAGTVLRRYEHGTGEDTPLAWYEGSGVDWQAGGRLLKSDHHGSIVLVTDWYGAPVAINSYDEYGIPGTGNVGRFQYTGQAWIPELGMYYYKARMYSPTLGRFMQTDPIGYQDQINLYAYVGNDPVNRTDPTGLEGGCFYGPSQCGMIRLTPEQERVQERQAAIALVGFAGITTGTVFAPEVLPLAAKAIGLGERTASIRVGNVLFRTGSAGSTRLAENAVVQAARGTLSGLARGEGRVFAGNGSRVVLREADNLAARYGGAAGDYQAVSSRVIAEGPNGTKVEVHAFRNVETGRIYDPKIKVQGAQ